jgi:hypothetical protein
VQGEDPEFKLHDLKKNKKQNSSLGWMVEYLSNMSKTPRFNPQHCKIKKIEISVLMGWKLDITYKCLR